jgi:tRNA (guanosine-2'-O-)-methyltransferase
VSTERTLDWPVLCSRSLNPDALSISKRQEAFNQDEESALTGRAETEGTCPIQTCESVSTGPRAVAKDSNQCNDMHPVFYGDQGLIPRSFFLDLLRGRLRPNRVARMEAVLRKRCECVTVLLENLAHPHNGAAILRTCECFGIQYIHVLESIEVFRCHSPTVPDEGWATRGVSRSCDQWLHIRRFHRMDECLACLRANGYQIVGTSLDTERSVPIDAVDFGAMSRICVVLGNEERGLSNAMQRNCDVLIHLPMVGFSQSLNVSVAAACILYHLRMRGCIQADLKQEQLRELYTRWLVRANRNTRRVLERNGIDYDEI